MKRIFQLRWFGRSLGVLVGITLGWWAAGQLSTLQADDLAEHPSASHQVEADSSQSHEHADAHDGHADHHVSDPLRALSAKPDEVAWMKYVGLGTVMLFASALLVGKFTRK